MRVISNRRDALRAAVRTRAGVQLRAEFLERYGVVASPNYPDLYPNYADCFTHIVPPQPPSSLCCAASCCSSTRSRWKIARRVRADSHCCRRAHMTGSRYNICIQKSLLKHYTVFVHYISAFYGAFLLIVLTEFTLISDCKLVFGAWRFVGVRTRRCRRELCEREWAEQRILQSRTNASFTNGSLVARLCGAATPRPMWIATGGGGSQDIARVVLYFHLDDSVRRAGFWSTTTHFYRPVRSLCSICNQHCSYCNVL